MSITYRVTRDPFSDFVCTRMNVDFVEQGRYPRTARVGWMAPMEAWCHEQFGSMGLAGGWWQRTGYTFRFRKFSHATLFRLTWHGVEEC